MRMIDREKPAFTKQDLAKAVYPNLKPVFGWRNIRFACRKEKRLERLITERRRYISDDELRLIFRYVSLP